MSALSELINVPTVMVNQFRSRRAIESRRNRRLAEFIDFAVRTVPYYQERYGIGSNPELEEIPVLDKRTLREVGSRSFLSDETMGPAAERLIWTNTSGTTGKRIEIAHDRDHFAYHNTACLRRFLATGRYRPWFRLLHFRPIGMPTRWYQRIGLFRRTIVLSSLPPQTLIDKTLSMRPQAIIGYPTTLRDLARRMSEEERRLVRRHLRLIFTESEMLLPEHRRQIEDWFGVPVFDEYSAYEVLNISFECSAHFAHVAEDRVLVEILDDDGQPVRNGDLGRVVVTAFQERAMPLIRYDLADRGRLLPGRCRCGRTFSRIELTEGRTDQHLTLPDGSAMSVGTFLYLAAEQPGVAESMVRQHVDGSIVVSIVPAEHGEFETVAAGFRDALHGLAGRAFPIEFVAVDSVPLTEGGKGRFLESEYRSLADR